MPLTRLADWLYIVASVLLLLLQHMHGETIYISRGDWVRAVPGLQGQRLSLGMEGTREGKGALWRMTDDSMGTVCYLMSHQGTQGSELSGVSTY